MKVSNSGLMNVLALLTLGLAVPACGNKAGDNHNNTVLRDGSLDASGIGDAGDAGDASVIPDAGLGPANCIEMGRAGIDDLYLPLLDPATQGDCDPVNLAYWQDKFHVLCKAPNNGILAVTTGSSPLLTEAARLPQQAEVPEGSALGSIHPRNLVFFSPDGSAQLAVVPFNMETATGTVLSGAFFLDAEGMPLIQTQRFDFDTLIAGGLVLSYFGAQGAEFSNGMVWFALENCDSAGQCIASDVMGVPVEERANGDWVMEDDVATWWTGFSGESHRPTAVSSVNNNLIVAAFSGIANNNVGDWKRPQVAFYDTSAPIILDDALRSFDVLGLTNSWQLTALPTVPMTHDKRSYVLAAENPGSGENRIVVMNVDDTGDIENTDYRVQDYNLPAELPNPARREGSDDPATIPVGGVTNIIVDGARAYVTTAGDGVNYGFLIVLDIDVSTGTITPVGSVGLGVGPTVAGLDPTTVGPTPNTGYIYQAVRKANCSDDDDARYLVRIDVDLVTFDPLP